jgi:hypothetical protein
VLKDGVEKPIWVLLPYRLFQPSPPHCRKASGPGRGLRYFEDESAVAIGVKARVLENMSVSAGIGVGISDTSSTYTANAGFSFSFKSQRAILNKKWGQRLFAVPFLIA